ncbi:MAG: amidase, partial [Rhodanobacteraceae bacterium]
MKSMKARRDFLVRMPLALVGMLAAWKLRAQTTSPEAVPGATPAFNTGEGTGPAVTQQTFADAEKLMQVSMSEAHREQAASSWRTAMAGTMERRVGPRRITLEAGLAPATVWNPELPGHDVGPTHDRFEPAHVDPGPLPARD